MPFGQSRLVDIHLTHRAFMYLASVLLISLIVVLLRRRVAQRYALALAGLLVIQILVGALNVWLDEYEWLIVLHLGLGTLLWATTLATALQVSPARERSPGRAEAVAA
jgi:heme A synthase